MILKKKQLNIAMNTIFSLHLLHRITGNTPWLLIFASTRLQGYRKRGIEIQKDSKIDFPRAQSGWRRVLWIPRRTVRFQPLECCKHYCIFY